MPRLSTRLTLPITAMTLLCGCSDSGDTSASESPTAATEVVDVHAPLSVDAEITPAAPAASTPAAAPAATLNAAKGLADYVGKYPFDEVDGVTWDKNPVVIAGLAATVRDAAVHKAMTTVSGPSAPIEMKDGLIASWACQAHNCGDHQWTVMIAPTTGATTVCYYQAKAGTQARWFLPNGKEEKRAGNCQ